MLQRYPSAFKTLLIVLLLAGLNEAARAQCSTPTANANNITTFSAVISWSPVSGAAGYEYLLDNSTSAPATAGTPTTSPFVQFTGLNAATAYVAHIRTACTAGYSSWTNVPFTTLASTCAAPTGVAASGISTSGAVMSWNAAAGSTGYEWVLDQSPSGPVVFGTFESNTTVILSSLSAATTYYFHVRNNCGGGNYSPWSTFSFTTTSGSSTCVAPSGLSAAPVTANSAYLTWTPVTGVIGYEYIVDQNPGNPAGFGVYTPYAYLTVSSLSSGTTYYYHLRTQCSSTNVSAWTTASFTTQQGLCPTPTSISASAITNTGATISWPPMSGVAGYEYVVSTSSSLPAAGGTPTGATSATISSLSPGTTYYAYVRSVCGGSNVSGWMYAPFTTTGANGCAAPSGLAVSGITSSGATFNWNAVAGAIGYEYVVDFAPGPPLSAPTPVASNTLLLNTLAPSTSFYLHVRTQCSAASASGWTDLPFTTLAAGCIAPAGISFSNITTSGAGMSWQPVSGAVGYEWAINNSAAAPAGPGNATTLTNAAQTGLQPGTTYYAHLRTNCGTGFSAWISAPFTTSTVAPCPAPTNLAITGITTTGAVLSWSAGAGVTGFEYQVDNVATSPTGAGTAVAATNTALSGLTAATTYYAHVRSLCGTTYSAWTNSAAFTTQATSVRNVNSTAGSVTLYPNPVQRSVTIRTAGRDGHFRITDLSGRLLADIPQTREETVVDMTGFAPGSYLVQYTDARHREVVRLVKE